MTYASRIFHHSKKLRCTHNALRNERAIFTRSLMSDARPSADKIDDISRCSQHRLGSGERHGIAKLGKERCFSPSHLEISAMGMHKGNNLWISRRIHAPQIGMGHTSLQQNMVRSFSSDSALPPHQEIGMPSLSPTMMEGNIARWLKKEGDKVSPGEVLCEVETDKATVEMECMEEGYLAKILRGDGSSGIKVGEVIAVTVEDEEDLAKFKDYSPSTSDTASAPKTSSASTPPKNDAVKAFPPHQEIGMPSLSPTMMEGNIARWLKKEGDKVSPGEVLCEVETDKATVEMECMEEGYLAKILRGDGSSGIKVGEVIAVTVEDEEDLAKFKDYSPSTSDTASAPKSPSASTPPKNDAVKVPVTPPEPKASKSKPVTPSSAGARIFASPLARKLAEDHKVSLSNIKGTGPDGRIVKADIEDYLANRGNEVSEAPRAGTTTIADIDYKDIPHSQIRKVTASRLLQSKQTIPHYYLTVDTCVDKLMELRTQLNSLQQASGGKRISVNDLVIKAAALALRKVPQCNSSWTNEYIRQYHNVNINVAVQTDNGLYVPVIRDADKKGLSKISDEVKHIAQKAKENSLKPEDYEGGTFTVSNLGGPFGIKQFCAIINPPQAGILAVGSAEKRVVPGTGLEQYKFSSFMPVTLSCDHRVIDGAIGAEWLKAFKGYIENPESMLL